MTNSLVPDQARHFVGPDLGPNCLQSLSADDNREAKNYRHIVISAIFQMNWLKDCFSAKVLQCGKTY